MLFALFAADLDPTAAQTLQVGGWVGGLLSLVVTALNVYLGYRLNRDRLQFDAQVGDLKSRVRELEGDLADAKVAEGRISRAEERCRQELDELRKELHKLTQYLLMNGMPVKADKPLG